MQSINTYEKILRLYGYNPSPDNTDIEEEFTSFYYEGKDDRFVWINVDNISGEVDSIFISNNTFYTNDNEFGSPGILLVKEPDIRNKYSLDILEETIKAVCNPVLQEYKIATAHAKNMKWVIEELYPVLDILGYTTDRTGIIDPETYDDDYEINLYFEKNDDYPREGVWVSTNKFTGELSVSASDIPEDLAWKNSFDIQLILEGKDAEENNSH